MHIVDLRVRSGRIMDAPPPLYRALLRASGTPSRILREPANARRASHRVPATSGRDEDAMSLPVLLETLDLYYGVTTRQHTHSTSDRAHTPFTTHTICVLALSRSLARNPSPSLPLARRSVEQKQSKAIACDVPYSQPSTKYTRNVQCIVRAPTKQESTHTSFPPRPLHLPTLHACAR